MEDFISIANALIWRICFKILTVVISFFIQLSAEKYFETYHLDFCRWNWLFILNWIFWQEIRAYSFHNYRRKKGTNKYNYPKKSIHNSMKLLPLKHCCLSKNFTTWRFKEGGHAGTRNLVHFQPEGGSWTNHQLLSIFFLPNRGFNATFSMGTNRRLHNIHLFYSLSE